MYDYHKLILCLILRCRYFGNAKLSTVGICLIIYKNLPVGLLVILLNNSDLLYNNYFFFYR
jgi:hypothetical protein